MKWTSAFFRKIFRWIGDRLKDLFYGVNNRSADLARVIAALFAGMAAFALIWNSVHLGKEIDLNGFLLGLAALATAIWAGVAAKDWVRSKVADSTEDLKP